MRLIDADALQKLFNDVSTELLGKTPFDKDIEHQVRAFLMVAEMIADAPTIDAEPVRHARLLVTEAYPHRLYCGGCTRMLIPNEEYCFEVNRYPSYCMYCGTKFDEMYCGAKFDDVLRHGQIG